MAYNAGSIEATLDLNRNAFNRGLQAARRDAQKFAREKFEVRITPKLDKADLRRIKAEIERVTGNIKAKVSLDNASLQAIKQRIDRTVGNIRVKLDIDQAALRAKLAALKATINVNLKITQAEKLRIKREIEAISPTIRIRLRYDRSQLDDLINRLRRASGEARRFNQDSDQMFGSMDRTVRAVILALPLLAPLIASAGTALAGLAGGLGSLFGTVGLSIGALLITAIPVFKEIQKGAAGSYKELSKLPPGIREAAKAYKDVKTVIENLTKDTKLDVGKMFAAGFKAAEIALRPLAPLIRETAKAGADIGKQFQDYFSSTKYTGFVSFLAANVRPMLDKIGNILVNTIRGVNGLIIAFQPLAVWILDKINSGMEKFAKWAESLANNKKFQEWLKGAQDSLEIWFGLIGNILTFLGHLVVGLKPLGDVLAKAISGFFDQLNRIPPDKLAQIAMGIAGIMTALMLGAGGPVALGIGAIFAAATALSQLYNTNENVRKSLDAFVGWLKKEWQPIWDQIKGNFEKYILPAWDKLVKVAKEELPKAFEAVKNAYEQHIKPTFGPLIDSLTGPDGLIPAFLDFATVVLPGVVRAVSTSVETIGAIIGGLITIFTGAFTVISGALTTFAGLFSGDWDKFGKGLETIAKGFLTIVAGLFGTTYDDLIKQGQKFELDMDNWWDGFLGGFNQKAANQHVETRNGFRIMWDDIHTGALNFENTMDTWTENFINGVAKFFSDGWAAIQRRFDEFGNWFSLRAGEVATAVGKAWRAVGNFFREPINWVIRVVINDGILGGWNKVMGWIGQPALKADLVPEIPAFASGGSVRGPGTGTSDSIPALLSAGEFVVSAKYAKQHEHFLAALNAGQAEAVQAAGGGNNPNRYPRYQAGGPVGPALSFAKMQEGKPYVWGGVGPGGYDCSGFMSAIANVLLGRNPYSRLGTTASAPWPGWARGLTSQFGVGWYPPGQRGTGHMAGTLAGNNVESGSGHGPMVGKSALGATNFPNAMSLPQVGGQFIGGGPGGFAQLVSWWSLLSGQVSSLFNNLLNFGAMPGNGSLIGNAITNIPRALVGKVIDALKAKLTALMTTVGGTASAAGGAGGAAVTAAVKAVADRYGWGTGPEWNALSMLIQKESGWNPAAANPTSSARGLFQKMTSIHGPVESTAGGQAEWGLNYIKSRYGTPSAAWAFHQAHNYYDRGGLIPPGVGPINTSSHVERILSPQQTQDFHDLVSMLSSLVGGGTLSGRGDTYHVMLPAGASVRELANEIDFRKRVATKGRYAPR